MLLRRPEVVDVWEPGCFRCCSNISCLLFSGRWINALPLRVYWREFHAPPVLCRWDKIICEMILSGKEIPCHFFSFFFFFGGGCVLFSLYTLFNSLNSTWTIFRMMWTWSAGVPLLWPISIYAGAAASCAFSCFFTFYVFSVCWCYVFLLLN